MTDLEKLRAAMVKDLTTDEIIKVKATADKLRAVIDEDKDTGVLAFALVAFELDEEERKND